MVFNLEEWNRLIDEHFVTVVQYNAQVLQLRDLFSGTSREDHAQRGQLLGRPAGRNSKTSVEDAYAGCLALRLNKYVQDKQKKGDAYNEILTKAIMVLVGELRWPREAIASLLLGGSIGKGIGTLLFGWKPKEKYKADLTFHELRVRFWIAVAARNDRIEQQTTNKFRHLTQEDAGSWAKEPAPQAPQQQPAPPQPPRRAPQQQPDPPQPPRQPRKEEEQKGVKTEEEQKGVKTRAQVAAQELSKKNKGTPAAAAVTPFTPREDEMLQNWKQRKHKSYMNIATKLGRTEKECRERYEELNPRKLSFSPAKRKDEGKNKRKNKGSNKDKNKGGRPNKKQKGMNWNEMKGDLVLQCGGFLMTWQQKHLKRVISNPGQSLTTSYDEETNIKGAAFYPEGVGHNKEPKHLEIVGNWWAGDDRTFCYQKGGKEFEVEVLDGKIDNGHVVSDKDERFYLLTVEEKDLAGDRATTAKTAVDLEPGMGNADGEENQKVGSVAAIEKRKREEEQSVLDSVRHAFPVAHPDGQAGSVASLPTQNRDEEGDSEATTISGHGQQQQRVDEAKSAEGRIEAAEGDAGRVAASASSGHEQPQQRVDEAERAAERREIATERAIALLRPLSEDDRQIVDDAIMGQGPPGEILSQVGADFIQRVSMRCLQDGEWLNDEVIHYFFTMLGERNKELCRRNPSRKRSHFFKSFFITKLLNEGHPTKDGQEEYSNVEKWSNKVPGKDIFNLDKIFFPINLGVHWMCAVVNMTEKRIEMYDSLGSDGMKYLKALFQYIKDEHLAKKESPLPDEDEWELVGTPPGTPHQHNGYDCGVFTCMFADFLSQDWPFEFTQLHVTRLRQHIALTIMQKGAVNGTGQGGKLDNGVNGDTKGEQGGNLDTTAQNETQQEETQNETKQDEKQQVSSSKRTPRRSERLSQKNNK